MHLVYTPVYFHLTNWHLFSFQSANTNGGHLHFLKGDPNIKLFFSSHFPSAKYFLCCRKLCSEQPDVFFSFSCIFGCELRVFSVNLDAEHWNLEFFGWTKNVVWVNPKNSRFQCEASRWTEKTVREHPKIKEKLKKTQVVAHCIVFLLHRNNFEEGKWLEWNFSGWTWAQLRCSQYHFLNERKLTYT